MEKEKELKVGISQNLPIKPTRTDEIYDYANWFFVGMIAFLFLCVFILNRKKK